MFETIHTKLERLARYAVWVGGAALLISAVIVTIDVLCRKFLGVTMSGSDEISGYVFAASTTWAYSYCLLHRANIRIDAFYNLLPKAVCAVLDVIGTFLLMGYMSLLTVRAYAVFATSWENNAVSITTLGTPLWIPQLLWVMGLVLFMITLLFVFTYSLVTLLKGDIDGVNRIAGVPSVKETMDEETHGMGIRTAHPQGEA